MILEIVSLIVGVSTKDLTRKFLAICTKGLAVGATCHFTPHSWATDSKTAFVISLVDVVAQSAPFVTCTSTKFTKYEQKKLKFKRKQ